MQTIGERLKYLRKDILKSNQENFANKLKISQSFFAQLEKNQRNFTDRMISDVCREFNVSEDWLRNGNGEIFIEKPTEVIDVLTEEYKLDSIERSIVENFISADVDERNQFLSFLRNMTNDKNNIDKELELLSESFTEPFTIIEKGETYSTILVKNEDLELIKQTLIDDDLVNAMYVARGGEKGSVMVKKSDIANLNTKREDL